MELGVITEVPKGAVKSDTHVHIHTCTYTRVHQRMLHGVAEGLVMLN